MSCKTDLERNNANLQMILDIANTLPEASNGASVRTCTVIPINHYTKNYICWTGIDENGDFANHVATGIEVSEITAVCGTDVVFLGAYLGRSTTHGECYTFGGVGEQLCLYDVPADTTVTVTLTQD